ncbi:MAG: hypothetical protein ACOYO0_09375 [Sandarakinorhabdus sp.]
MKIAQYPKTLALVGAIVIAAGGFAAAQIWGEGAGMPIVAGASTLWVAWFVAWQARARRP